MNPNIAALTVLKVPSDTALAAEVLAAAPDPDAAADPDTWTEVALYATLGTPNTAVELNSAVTVPLEQRSEPGVVAVAFVKRACKHYIRFIFQTQIPGITLHHGHPRQLEPLLWFQQTRRERAPFLYKAFQFQLDGQLG